MSEKNFTIYKSSAGSGKTFTLVKEYLALALSDANNPPIAYKNILAITFTNKAANEMKERIVQALKDLSKEDYSQLNSGAKTLLEILKQNPTLNSPKPIDEKTIRERSLNVLTAILHNYSDFAIGTIDSFVHKIVRTFAFDLKIPMAFDLEMDGDKLLRIAIDLLITQIGTNEDLTKCLVEFTESKTDNEKSWHIENDLLDFAKNLLNEEGSIYIEKLKDISIDEFFKIKTKLFTEIRKFEQSVIKEAELAWNNIVRIGLSKSNFYYGTQGIGNYFEKLANGVIENIEANSRVVITIEKDNWYGSKISADTKSTIDGIKPILLKHYNRIQQLKDSNYSDYVLFKLISNTIYSLAVLNEIEKTLYQYKSENNILHISEFNKLIAKIILSEPIPFIYERLGERYKNYLIDEFQDTSVMQFQNLLPLIDNSLATSNFTMLVGDGKQAIYRWRGGEVEQFANLPKVFSHQENKLVKEREASLIRNHNPEVLKKNFRSKREIIEFNNSFFRAIASTLDAKSQHIYENLEQEFNPENTGGFVQVDFIEKEGYTDTNKQKTKEIIEELVKADYPLSDIAILVRRNSDGSLMANYLIENGIHVISSESLLIGNSREVNFMYAWVKYIVNPWDAIAQTEIINYLITNKYCGNSLLSDSFDKNKNTLLIDFLFKNKIDINWQHLESLSIYELFEELILLFNLNKRPDAYIQFFLDEVLTYITKNNSNLRDFVEYWEEKKETASLIIPQGVNAVNIMTIHRSKGLEFPIVILPFANGKVDAGKKFLWLKLDNVNLKELPAAIVPTNKNLELTSYADLYLDEMSKSKLDIINVLYVAMTRAEKQLYVLTGKPSKSASSLSSIPNMFHYYFDSRKDYSETNSTYTFGNKANNELTSAKNNTNSFTLETFNSTRWRELIRMKGAASLAWNTEEVEIKKQYGVMIHTALSKIQTEDDVEDAVKWLLQQGIIMKEEMKELVLLLNKIVFHPQLNKYFKENLIIKNEAEIIAMDGEFHRPDRIVIEGKNAVIIDYKTGREQSKHKEQIERYANLLREMNYTITDKLLVYIEEEKVVRC